MPADQFLGKTVKVQVDRPLGSRHPAWKFLYLVNYGYLPGIPAADGEDQDAYILGIAEPLEEFEGTCIAVIHRLNDVEDKLVVAPPGEERSFTAEDIRRLTEFQECDFQIEIRIYEP